MEPVHHIMGVERATNFAFIMRQPSVLYSAQAGGDMRKREKAKQVELSSKR